MWTTDKLKDNFKLIAGKARLVVWYINMYDKISLFKKEAKKLKHGEFWGFMQGILLLHNIIITLLSIVDKNSKISIHKMEIKTLVQASSEESISFEKEKNNKVNQLKKIVANLQEKYKDQGYLLLRDKAIAHTDDYNKCIQDFELATGKRLSVYLEEIREDMISLIAHMNSLLVFVLNKEENVITNYLDTGIDSNLDVMTSLADFLRHSLPVPLNETEKIF